MSFMPRTYVPVKITLYKNVPFDNSYKDHFYTSTKFKFKGSNLNNNITFDEFLKLRKTYSSVTTTYYFPFLELDNDGDGYNFNYSNQIVTSFDIDLTDYEQFITANYMVVENNSGDDDFKRYYFIKSVNQLNGKTYRLELELDVIATFQDEIMDGLNGQPIEVKRKHDHRFTSLDVNTYLNAQTRVFCPDLMLADDLTRRYEPKNISKTCKPTPSYPDIPREYIGTDGHNFPILWLYATAKGGTSDITETSIIDNSLVSPVRVYCLPLVKNIIFHGISQSSSLDLQINDIPSIIKSSVFDDENTYAIKISPYPPFTRLNALNSIVLSYDSGEPVLTFNIDDETPTATNTTKLFSLGLNKFIVSTQLLSGCIGIMKQIDTSYSFNTNSISNDLIKDNVHIPTLNTLRSENYEPRLYTSPIKKIELKTQYTQPIQIYPEYAYTYLLNSSYRSFSLETIATCYGNDMIMSTYVSLNDVNSLYHGACIYDDGKQKEINNGLIAQPNYTFPKGTDALKQWESTAQSSFINQQISKGVTSIATSVLGMMLSMNPATAIIGTGMAITGAIGGATAGTSLLAKNIDLINTPDTISNLGGNYIHDLASVKNLFPYFVIYEPTPSEKENFLDYFYKYGYQVERCCLFNSELFFNYLTGSSSNYTIKSDDNIFTRDIFNYVQTTEDIQNKIHADIPQNCKQKISNIFKQGVTLWTFFNFDKYNMYTGGVTKTGHLYDYLLNNKYENNEIYTNEL